MGEYVHIKIVKAGSFEVAKYQDTLKSDPIKLSGTWNRRVLTILSKKISKA